jgi:hypothetical protein
MAENVAEGPGQDEPSGENEQRGEEEELLAQHRKPGTGKKYLQGIVHILVSLIT